MGITGWFFLGLTDFDADGVFEWPSDGSTVTWTFWTVGGEPTAGQNTNCGAMNRAATIVADKKRWNPVHCKQATTQPVVCETTRKYTIHYEKTNKQMNKGS